jgi:transglutaminase-like putative cysteine protease
MDPLRRANWRLLVMVGLVSLLVSLAVVGQRGPTALDVAWGLLLWCAAVGAHVLLPKSEQFAPRWIAGLLLAALLLPAAEMYFFTPAATRLPPMATSCVFGLRNVMLVAAVFSLQPRLERVAASCSAFLVLVAFSLGSGLAVFFAATLYTVTAALWLMNRYWTSIARQRVAGRSAQMPWIGIASVSCSLVAVILAAVLLYPGDERSLQEMVLDWIYDRDDAYSLRMRATQFELEQEALDEMAEAKYGESEIESTGGSYGDAEDSMFKRASDFSTIRRQSRTRANEPGKPLFYMQGPTAVHLPVTHYGDFDGAMLKAESAAMTMGPRISTTLNGDQAWKAILDPKNSLLAKGDLGAGGFSFSRSSLRTMDADTIDKLRQLAAQYARADRPLVSPEFQELDAAALEAAMAKTPYWPTEMQYLGTHYDLDLLLDDMQENPELMDLVMTMTLDRQEEAAPNLAEFLRQWRLSRSGPVLPPEMAEVVRQWIKDKPPGRPQIDAVIEHLRTDYTHDPRATVPADQRDSVRYFLLESKRGPDYLFATSATVILRSLGYPARVAGGYYAPPERYSWLTGRNEVRSDDVHFWTQVWVAKVGMWVDLEPTPGYELPQPSAPYGKRLAAAWNTIADWLRWNIWWTSAAALLLVLAAGTRRVWTDVLRTAWWRLRWRDTTSFGRDADRVRRFILDTCSLLERRARSAGLPRPVGETWRDWLPRLLDASPELQREAMQLAGLATWAAFAPQRSAPPTDIPLEQAPALCRAVAGRISRKRLRRLAKERRRPPSSNERLQPGLTT